MRLLNPAELVAERILVIAPHPDDESLGCGGMLATLGALGRVIHTVFMTDGSASHRNSPTWPRQRLAMQREREASEALSRLGLGRQPRTFLRLPDAAMPHRKTAAGDKAFEMMRSLARAVAPDLVLLPWRRDPHCDHRDSWRLATEALAAEGMHPHSLEYAIWLDELGDEGDRPLPAEAKRVGFCLVPEVLELKRAAVAAHLSQTTDLIADDPDAFRLTAETIGRLVGPTETYWKPST